jgi:ABC-2 type transport system permease protein
MLGAGSAALTATGSNAAMLWESWPFVKMTLVIFYALVVMTLWYAPIYGYVLFVSSWARGMAFLWVVLPPLGLCLAERIALDTRYLSDLLDYRVNGYLEKAFYFDQHSKEIGEPLSHLTPVTFLMTPGLWIGLVVAVGLMAGAVWLRRSREAI